MREHVISTLATVVLSIIYFVFFQALFVGVALLIGITFGLHVNVRVPVIIATIMWLAATWTIVRASRGLS